MSHSGREPWDADDPYPGGDFMPEETQSTVILSLVLKEDEAEALAQMCKRFGASHATSLANAFDGGREGEHMLRAITIVLRRALAEQGFDPR